MVYHKKPPNRERRRAPRFFIDNPHGHPYYTLSLLKWTALKIKPHILRRNIMVEITPSAHHQIAEYFKNKEVQPIRIFLNEGG